MKPNQGNIIVKSEVKPVHSFDLWGTIAIQDVLGPRVLEAYRQLMTGRETPERIAQNIANYEGVLRGDKKALDNKKANVDAIEDPLWKAYMGGDISVSFEGALYQDAISVMEDIARAGEGLCILTTGNSPWVRKALMSVNPQVGEILGKVYSGNKAKPEAYETEADDLRRNGLQMVSHTEDQLKGLAGLLCSTLKVKIVYVERADLATLDEAIKAGADIFTRDLREVNYGGFAR